MKRIVLYSAIIFILLSASYFFIAVIVQINTNEIKKSEILQSEELLVAAEKNILSNTIYTLTNDLEFIADVINTYGFEDNGADMVEDIWKDFSNRIQIYDQIRYIDAEGYEQIRINYTPDGAVSVDTSQLQNKKHRYYFTETMALRSDQIYISKLDLNIENDEIEQPIKPMIRISKPLFDQDGTPIGIVILNYYAKYLLEDFKNIATTSRGQMFMLNADGYWISHSENADNEWAFMYEDRADIRFQTEFSAEWEEIRGMSIGTVSSSNGYFTYSYIIPSDNETGRLALGEGNWIVVSYLPSGTQGDALFFSTVYHNIVFVVTTQAIMFVPILIISILLSLLIITNRRSRDRIRYFSEYDTMTEVLNRRAGLTLLTCIYKNTAKAGGSLSVCFIDVNCLKEVNDGLGHDMGDELLITIANSIQKSIRKSDYVVRLGGDEFLLILTNSDKNMAEAIWQRVKNTLDNINENENRAYMVSASHGIAECRFETDEHFNQVLNEADEKMYEEKRQIKKTCAYSEAEDRYYKGGFAV